MGRLHSIANIALGVISVLPIFTTVNPNVNVVITACLVVFIGSWRSVKASPTETMSKEHAMRFPIVGSVVLLSLFLLFKFLPKDFVNGVLTSYFVFLGILALTATTLPIFEPFLPKEWNEKWIKFTIPYLASIGEFEFTISHIIASIPSSIFCAYYLFTKHWFTNNVLGISFSIQGIEMLSLGSFKIGAILLVGLFFYDIFWVFFTPVMVSVAKSFEAPIKLLFPTGNASRPFSLLGLGDIVIPGIFLALALRFDLSRGNKPKYFWSSFFGYTFGIITTIVVMNVFQAAQPALLYIVPGVIGFTSLHGHLCGEIKDLLGYDETVNATDDSSKEDEVVVSKKDD